ncbi:MAG: class B sortase [Coriobacteriales bacterium]|nr:class B sortase [Coriobacteriales bacterium]
MSSYQGRHAQPTADERASERRGDRAAVPEPPPLAPLDGWQGLDVQQAQADKRRKRVSRVLLVISILLITAAIAIAASLFYKYFSAQQVYDSIAQEAGAPLTIGEEVEAGFTLDQLTFNWDALHAMNPEIVAWVLVPGTRINYPIVQGPDNEYYLTHLFDDSGSGVGAVFLDYEGAGTLDARNNMIYGHDMRDGSMFAAVRDFMEQGYFDEHRTVFIATPTMNYELKTIATVRCDENAPIRLFGFGTDEDFEAYKELLLSSALIVDEAESAQALSVYQLVTCDSPDNSKRVILVARPIATAVPKGA